MRFVTPAMMMMPLMMHSMMMCTGVVVMRGKAQGH
jgi:hypothetical protein